VSRSGGTLTAGLFIKLTRETATRYSFLLAIPAVVLSGLFELENVFNPEQGGAAPTGAQMVVATVIAASGTRPSRGRLATGTIQAT